MELNDISFAVMSIEQIKDNIRKASRSDKSEIYRWMSEEEDSELLAVVGAQDNWSHTKSFGKIAHHHGVYYTFKDGFLTGTYNTFEESMKALREDV